MKRLSVLIAAGLALLALGITLVSGSCAAKLEGFAIYLTADDVPPSKMEALSHVEIAEKPVIAASDIISYDSSTHEITLTADAFNRTASLGVPVWGRSFLVCVDREPIYWGAFWTPISSMSFNGVTIWKPFGTQGATVIALELGYPSQNFYDGADPRSNPEVMQALRQANKLTGVAAIADMLPKSMKGYELYSWQQDGEWHFTLITGTNRNKTTDEIIEPSNTVTADDWVQINVTGVDAVKTILGRVPEDEWVSWMSGALDALTGITFARPGADTVADIQDYALQRGLNFITG